MGNLRSDSGRVRADRTDPGEDPHSFDEPPGGLNRQVRLPPW